MTDTSSSTRAGRLGLPLLALLAAACSPDNSGPQTPPPPTVTVASPVVREIVEDDEYVGRFEAIDEVEVRARVGGYLQEIHFTEGRLVSAGDLLFTIDQRPFQATLSQSEAQLRIAETKLEFAQNQHRRAEELSGRGDIPVATLDERRQDFVAAEAEVEAARAALTRAKLDMEFTEIRSPIAGRIGARRISAGNLVQADATILTSIVSFDPIHFYFDIDERAYLAYAQNAAERRASLQEGSASLPVRVRVGDFHTTEVQGELDFAENRLDAGTGTLRVRARMPNPDHLLQPGLFGRINVPGSPLHPGILIPDEAVAADQDRRIVYVVDDDGLVSAKPVRPGPRLYGYRVIREGLTGDETIVINGLMRVRQGIKVTPERVELPAERT
jgi:RND family efflux transporter MFP subunit